LLCDIEERLSSEASFVCDFSIFNEKSVRNKIAKTFLIVADFVLTCHVILNTLELGEAWQHGNRIDASSRPAQNLIERDVTIAIVLNKEGKGNQLVVAASFLQGCANVNSITS